MNNKKGSLSLDKFVIGFAVFSLMIFIGVSLISDINVNYDVDIDTGRFNKTYDVMEETYNLSQDIKSQTIDADISEEESWQSMAKGSYSSIRLVSQTFSLVGAIVNDISFNLGIDERIVMFVMTIISIAVFFAIIYLVMGVVRN